MKKIFASLWMVVALNSFGFEILIDKGTDEVSKVAVVPFRTPAGIQDMTPIIEFDLHRSGQFSMLHPENMLSFPSKPEEVNFRDWRVLGIEYLVIGDVGTTAESTLEATFNVYDVTLERRLYGGVVSGPLLQFRDISHRVADRVFEAITQIPGAFSTKVMYVMVLGRGTEEALYRLDIADSDGANVHTILESYYPIMSPTWSPTGDRVAYVTFEEGRSTVVIHEIATGNRETISAFEGTNSAPAFSPDGTHIALTLSRDGNPEIYTMRLRDHTFRRITSHRGIDTEPAWTPDGSSILFTSDRSGSPQVYQVDLDTLYPKRLTFTGDYNARPRALPDGKHVLYVHRIQNQYHIVWQALASEEGVIVLTENVMDESPSIAPNGAMAIFATKDRGKGILGMVSLDGQVEFKLPSSEGDVQEPAWSPYLTSSLTLRDFEELGE